MLPIESESEYGEFNFSEKSLDVKFNHYIKLEQVQPQISG